MTRPVAFTLGFILAAGIGVRLLHLDAPLLSFHATRQYRSALIARAASPVAMAALPAIEQPAARLMGTAQHDIEPRVMETVAAASYAALGREDLRAPRIVSILAWTIAAAAAAWLVRLSVIAWPFALAALAFALFAPYGVDASRAFMPDPLMTGLTMVALAVMLRHHQAASRGRAAARVIAAAAAICVKPMAAFFLVPAMIALDVARMGLVRGVLTAATAAGLAAMPAAVYYVSLISGGSAVAENRFLTALWWRPTFWQGWLAMIDRVIGWPALALSLGGLALARGPLRVLLCAAWGGYVVLGLLFTHHISTHDYYSLPLIPLAASTLALGADGVGRRWSQGVARLVWAATIVAVVLSLGPRLTTRTFFGDLDGAKETARDYSRIGERLGHSTRVVSLDGSYGYPLAYHARIGTSQLPLSIDRALGDISGRSGSAIAQDLASRNGDFFVGTIQPEFDAQPDLRALLHARHVLIDRGGTPAAWRYIAYDLRALRVSAVPEAFSLFARADGGERTETIQLRAAADVHWRAVSPTPARIRLEPESGSGDTAVRVVARPGRPGEEERIAVSFFAGNSARPSGQLWVNWRTLPAGANAPPFGFVDVPADPVPVGEAPIVFQGWALDDLQLARVEVWAQQAATAARKIGDATLAGRRPDVAAAYPTAHDLERSAWAFVLEAGALKPTGLGAPGARTGDRITLSFRAVDVEGASAPIGQRALTIR